MTAIRSYRRVFDLERRIYSVDQLRLNPGGVPVRGVVYFLVLIVISLIVGVSPLAGSMVHVVPWFVRDLVAPGLAAMVLSVVRIEGRAFHLAAGSLLAHAIAPRLSNGLSRRAPLARWDPEEIVALPDGSDGAFRRLRYTGPGAVLVALEYELADAHDGGLPRPARGWRGRRLLVLRQGASARRLTGRRVLVLESRARVVVTGPRDQRRRR